MAAFQTVALDADRELHPTLGSRLRCARHGVTAIDAAEAATQRSIETVCYLVTGPTTRSPRVVVQAVVGSNPIAHPCDVARHRRQMSQDIVDSDC